MAEGTLPPALRLQAAQPIDVTDCFAVPTGSLSMSDAATSVCMHPTKPLLAVAAGTSLAVYDLVSCTRLSRHDMKSKTVEMAFAPDGIMLVMVLQDWMVVGLSMATWRVHLLVPRKPSVEKPLESCLLAVSGGSRPSLFYCRYGKDSVRSAALSSADMVDAKGRPVRVKEGWGSKLKLEPVKPIMGLAMAPGDAILLVLHADGSLRAYNPQAGGDAAIPALFTVTVQDAAPKTLPAAGTLVVFPHPAAPGLSLIIQAPRLGQLVVLSHEGGATPPSPVFRARVPGLACIVGAGVLQDARQLVAYGLTETGRFRAVAWSLAERSATSDGPAMLSVKVEPADVGPLLDPRAPSQAWVAPGAPAPMPTPPPNSLAAASAAAVYTTSAVTDAMLGLAPPSGAGGGPKGKDKDKDKDKEPSEAATNARLVTSLWGGSPAWAQATGNSTALLGSLQPLVARAVVHPLLSVTALLLEPAQMVQMSPTMLRYTLDGASPEEYLLARMVLSVPLLSAATWGSAVGAGGAHALVCHAHTTLQHWTPVSLHKALSDPGAAHGSPPLGVSRKASRDGTPAAKDPAPPPPLHTVPLAGPHFNLPPHIFFLSKGSLCRYTLASHGVTTVITFPERVPGGGSRVVHSVAHSKAGAWLVFFEVVNGAPGQERWQWTCVLPGQLDGSVWLKPGKAGAFLGTDEDHFAVVDATGRLAAVFAVADCTHAGAAPLYLYSLDGLVTPAGALPVFAGPPHDPVVDPTASAVLGCVMWQSAAGGLACRPLPSVLDTGDASGQGGAGATGGAGLPPPRYNPAQRTMPLTTQYNYYNDGSSSTDEDGAGGDGGSDEDGPAEPKGTGAVMRDSNLGALGAKYWLPLQAGEYVLQVAWQKLAWDSEPPPPPAEGAPASEPPPPPPVEASGSDSDSDVLAKPVPETPLSPATGKKAPVPVDRTPCVAAVLTNQRVLIVTELLNVHAELHLSSHIRTSLPAPAANVLWVGPALLVHLVDGRVLQLTWTGAVHPVAAVAPSHTTHLVGATPDALLLLRQVPGGAGPRDAAAWEVVARPTSMLQPLVLGWATLPVLPNTRAAEHVVPACRKVLQALLAGYDARNATQGLVWALLGTCAMDLAFILASHQAKVGDQRTLLAAAAAAGEWGAVEAALKSEIETAAHHPFPPPAGSPTHLKLLAAAAGAVSHGQLARGVNMLTMAGEWRLAMAVAAAAGDGHALFRVATAVEAVPGAGRDAEAAHRLATSLRNMYGGGAAAVPNLKLTLAAGDGAPCGPPASSWKLGNPNSVLPAAVQVTSLEGMRGEPGEIVRRVPLEHPLVSALGLDPGTRRLLNLSSAMPTLSTDGSAPPTGGAAIKDSGPASTNLTPQQSALTSTSLGLGDLAPVTLPPPRPGATALDDIFGIETGPPATAKSGRAWSDADSDFDADSLSGAAPGTQNWKGKVTIREKGSGPTFAANPDELRDAMRSVKLAPPPSGSGVLASLAPIPSVGAGLAPPAPPLLTGMSSGLSPALQGSASGAVSGSGAATTLSPPRPAAPPLQPDIFDFLPAPATAPSAAAPAAASKAASAVASAAGSPRAAPLAPAGSVKIPPPPAAAPSAAPLAAFKGVSPALLAGMQQQQQPGRVAAPAPAAAAGATPQSFGGLSPALLAGMQSQPQPPAAAVSRTASAAPAPFSRAASAAPTPAAAPTIPPPASLAGLSPALAAGMRPASPAAPTKTSPAKSGGLPPAALAGLSPALAAGMVVNTPSAPPQPAPPPQPPAPLPVLDASQAEPLFHQGVGLLEGARWAEAAAHFSASLTALQQQPPNEQRRSKQAFCAHYLAAVQLLAVATRGAGLKEARLYRYAAALPLETRHRVALAREAVKRNKALQNFKYCADTLEWMATALVGSVPEGVLQQVQRDIQECEANGGRNASVPPDEDLRLFTELTAGCGSGTEVHSLVGPICALP